MNLHPRQSARSMPRAWTEAIERERAAFNAIRTEAAGTLTEIRTLIASLPPPATPVDPEPLIAPIRAQAAQAATAAAEATSIAETARSRADAAMAQPQQSTPEQVLNVLRVISRVVAVRVLLFLSLAGTFTMALLAMAQGTPLALGEMVAFAVLTMGPLAWLETVGRKERRE